MAPATPLLGPPEIHRQRNPPPIIATPPAKYRNRFRSVPSMGLTGTENISATLLTTGDPCLDFFFDVVPDTPSETLTTRLHQAWSHDALTTLKLICNLRGVRGTGKSDKEGFYTAALWLHRNHPKTLAANVASIAEFGYFKDFPVILYRLLEDPEGADVSKLAKIELKAEKKLKRSSEEIKKLQPPITKEMAKVIREQRRVEMAKKALDRFNHDPDFRFLHDKISDLFADRLKSDLECLNSGKENQISLAAKWCPSIDSSFDRSTLLCETIARKVFPKESFPEYAAIEDAHYAYRVRDRLRKEVLVPLRKSLELPELYMSANHWNELPYGRVASVAMKTYKKLFKKHDSERFTAYLERNIAAGALLPHEVIALLDDEDEGAVAELQWKRILDDLASKGKMKKCIAVCDVCGWMSGTLKEICIALGILVSELSEEPWKGKVITFGKNPQLHIVQGEDLRSKVQFMRNLVEWSLKIDYQNVFDKILEVAVKAGLKSDEMIKRVIVFSDMEFDQASSNPWETDYMVIKRKYEQNGYGEAVPEIVFWNLRDSKATPVPGNQKGVALVSRFSKNLLGNDGIVSPLDVMEAAISGEDYQKLVVLD